MEPRLLQVIWHGACKAWGFFNRVRCSLLSNAIPVFDRSSGRERSGRVGTSRARIFQFFVPLPIIFTHLQSRHALFTERRRGFALLITVTLLAFLVLLLVSLAALTRVETQVAANNQQLAQARQNALMALNIAVGQLQKYMGPDSRVTAQANVLDSAVANPWFTGVWDTSIPGLTAQTWLVSGNESSTAAVMPSTNLNRLAAQPEMALIMDANGLATNGPASASPNRVRLVGGGSAAITGTGLDNGSVVVPGIPLNGTAPGFSSPRTIGRIAYWVGDQGVKAPLVSPDKLDQVNYASYAVTESRKRLRQQTAYDSSPVEWDPRETLNLGRVGEVVGMAQVSLLTFEAPADAAPIAATLSRFHDWSVANYSVLANTSVDPALSARGLRRDLSQKPNALGAAFEAYANYTHYMEAPGTTVSGAPDAVPAITADSPRRRYKITPPVADQGWQHGIAPVLTSFILQFNVRRVGGNSAPAATSALEVRSRFLMGLWNPYTSALVPEPLVLEIENLPTINLTANSGSLPINLQTVFGGGGAMRILLNFVETNLAFQGDPDDRSWLPGRLYYWRTKAGSVGAWGSEFYNRTLGAANADIWTMPTGSSYPLPATNGTQLALNGPATTLKLILKRASDNAVLATYTSPQFNAFSVPARSANSNDEYRITFPFRLVESFDTLTTDPSQWLKTAGGDPRRSELGLGTYVPFGSGGADPAAAVYVGTNIPISAPDRLLDRVMGATGMSFNEDVPLFELPRQPLLSVSELQHLAITAGRPFTTGNPWGAGGVNKLFDRYFFSGLVPGVTPDLSSGQPLPNITQRSLATKPDGSPVTLADIQAQAATGLSSKYLLQGASFNVNSTSGAAWRAVLRGVRFTSAHPLEYVDVAASSGGSIDDTKPRNLYATDAAFLRFSQSAQETYATSSPASSGLTYAASTQQPPSAPSTASYANTHLFRNGVRVLSGVELDKLSLAIAEGVRLRAAVSGPFRSLDEFLAPVAGADFAGRSVIERAIAEADINATVPEFSSQFLTQADVMNAIGPRLFVRSDTFLVRSFGEVVNPATGDVSGRAWCEAVVQRLPAPSEAAIPGQPTDTEYLQPPGNFGRSFKTISFRWLTASDI